jgi:hypothetical protein
MAERSVRYERTSPVVVTGEEMQMFRSLTMMLGVREHGIEPMTLSLQRLCEWLEATPLSTRIQNVDWIIPSVQTIHILSIAVVASAAAMVYLRVLGTMARGQTLIAVAERFLPWIWWTLVVLLLSGGTLIIGEPRRSLPNPAFLLKMAMLAAALLLTLLFQSGLRRDALFWESSLTRRIASRLIASASLILWAGIVFAGRWIAYIDAQA